MKKPLLLVSALIIFISAQAQPLLKGAPASTAKQGFITPTVINEQLPYHTQVPAMVKPVNTAMYKVATFTEAIIGQTIYDLQSNRGTSKRISNNGDGTLSAVWNFTPVGGTNGTDRGTGYNYFNGTNWGPAPIARIEPIRTGFTNIAVTQAGEFTVSHTGAQGMLQTARATKGAGAWDTVTVGSFNSILYQADVWCKLAVGGPTGNTVHVIVNSQGTGSAPVLGMNGPLTYSRSLDGGATWIDDHIQIPGTTASFFNGFDADEYHIDARGNVVAVVVGGFENNVVLFKSIDDGATWASTVVLPFVPGQVGDTIDGNGGDVTVTIDNNNICHVSVSHVDLLQDTANGTTVFNYFPIDNTGLYYWNESMAAPIIVAVAEDFNGNGKIDIPYDSSNGGLSMGRYNIGMIGQPAIGIDANNAIYLVYTAIDERADTLIYPAAKRHVFIIGSANNGATWSVPYTLNPAPAGNYQEAVWPSIATRVDSCLHITYQRDSIPGHSLSPTFFGVVYPNDIVYARVPAFSVLSVKQNIITPFEVSVIPNPANSIVTVAAPALTNASLFLYDAMGRMLTKQLFNAKASVDISSLEAGVYVVDLINKEGISTKAKLVKQ